MKMKFTLAFVALAVVALSQASILRGPSSRANLNHGYVQAGDKLLYRTYMQKGALPNAIQTQDLIYKGNSTTRISAVLASEVGYTQYANAWVISGGWGYNHTTVRFQTAKGWGYYYLVDIWGK